jgi:hypothetical protein
MSDAPPRRMTMSFGIVALLAPAAAVAIVKGLGIR